MAIEFDGKGNIVSTTEDGVIAVKLYSLEKTLEEKDKEIERLNNIINEIYMFLSQYTITHTWQKIVIEDTIKYIEELKGSESNE